MKPIALLVLAGILVAASFPVEGAPAIALVGLAFIASALALRTRDEWPMSPSTRLARFRLARARTRLAEITDIDAEDFAYNVANSAVIEAERSLPWWKRLDIELTH